MSKFEKIVRRFGDGGWALAEQGMQSATNFLTVALIGLLVNLETLAIYQMGRFVILLITGIQNSLISFPYTISFRTAETKPAQLAGSQLLLTIVLAVLTIPTLAIVWMLPWETDVRNMIAALFLALPAYLVREFYRRHDFAHLRTRFTFILSLCLSLIQIAGMLLLWKLKCLNAANVFLVIALACFLTVIVWSWLRRREFEFGFRGQDFARLKTTIGENWTLGKWIFSTQGLSDVLLTVIQWALGGKAVGGMFAACFQIASLCNPVVMGLANLLPPKFAQVLAESGRARLMESIQNFNKSFLIIVGAIAIGLCLFCEPLLRIVSKETVTSPYHLTFVLAMFMLVQAVGLPAYHGLNAIREPAKALLPRLVGILSAAAFFGLAKGWESALIAAYSLLIAHFVISTLTFYRAKSSLELNV